MYTTDLNHLRFLIGSLATYNCAQKVSTMRDKIPYTIVIGTLCTIDTLCKIRTLCIILFRTLPYTFKVPKVMTFNISAARHVIHFLWTIDLQYKTCLRIAIPHSITVPQTVRQFRILRLCCTLKVPHTISSVSVSENTNSGSCLLSTRLSAVLSVKTQNRTDAVPLTHWGSMHYWWSTNLIFQYLKR